MKFIRSVIDEMKLVTWPTRKQLVKDVRVVIETSLIFALMFAVMDKATQAVFGWVLK